MWPRSNVLRYWAHVISFQSRVGNIVSMILQYRIVVVSILRQNTQYRIEFDFAGIAHHGQPALKPVDRLGIRSAVVNRAVTYISDKVAVCIAEVLESNCSLQVLNVRSNGIGNVGFDHIAKSLESNTTLRELHLVCNCGKLSMNDEKVQAIHRIRQEKGFHPVYIGM